MKNLNLLTATTLLALTLPVSAQTLNPQQNQPVAGLADMFSQRPACSQLEARPGDLDGWQAWGMPHNGDWVQFYGLETLPPADAFSWLEKAGVCVIDGAVIDFATTTKSGNETTLTPGLTDMEARNAARTERVANGDTEGNILGICLLVGAVVWMLNRNNDDKDTNDSYYPAPMASGMAYQVPTAREVIDSIPVINNAPDTSYEPQMGASVADEDPTAYKLLLANPFLSRIFYGGQRTGKTMLMAKASEALASQGVEVYHINLASYGDEDSGYFQHAKASVTGDLVQITDTGKAHRLIEKAEKVVNAFMQSTTKSILICDEWKYMTNQSNAHAERLEALVNRVADIIAGFESAGMKRAKAAWTAAPGIVAGNMQQGGKAVKGLEPVIVAIAPGHTEQWNGQSLTFDYQVFNQVAKNYQGIEEPTGYFDSSRIAFIAGQWLALGNYPKSKPQQPQQSDEFLSDERRFVQWATTQKAVPITYERFRNANAMKALPRSKEAFDEFTDYGVLAGVLSPCGDGAFKPTT